jgi:flagellar biosynthesis protein FlhG
MELAFSNTGINSTNKPKAKVIAVTSGKGGVGKSSTATNLALSLSALDKKVCVFDADASLANINILLGLQPQYTLQHLLNGEKNLKEIILDGPRGLKVIPGATGISEYAHLSNEQKAILLAALDKLQQEFDYLIIDTAAGIGDDVLDFINASQFSIIIITPEPTSLTDSFSLLKVLKRSNYNRTSFVLVNMAMDDANSQTIYKRFESAVKKYVDIDIAYLGYIQVDETMISSVSLQCPAVLLSPESTASKCFQKLALKLDKSTNDSHIDSFSEFWRQQSPPNTPIAESTIEQTAPSFIAEPRPTQIKPAPPTTPAPLDFQQAAAFCLKQLSDGTLSSDSSEAFFKSIAPYQAKPDIEEQPKVELPTSTVREFYNYLEKNAFPKDDIRDVVTTLEQVYFEKYGQNVNSLDSATLKLFAQFNGSEDDLRFVNKQLTETFQREFNKPLYDVIEHIQRLTQSSEHTQQELDDVLSELLTAYQQRFQEAYKTKADADLEQTKQELETLKQQQAKQLSQLEKTKVELSEKADLLEKIQQLFPNP